jgi:hypothetical protein
MMMMMVARGKACNVEVLEGKRKEKKKSLSLNIQEGWIDGTALTE